MSTVTAGILAGLLMGLGLTGLLYAFVPRGLPHLGDAMDRISPHRPALDIGGVSAQRSWTELLGDRAHPHMTSIPGFRIPAVDLRLLQKSTGWFVGRKIIAVAFGLLAPSAVSFLAWVAGFTLPFTLPLLISLILATAMWFVPDMEVNGKAQEARDEYRAAVTAYIGLVHLEKLAGLDAGRALKEAALVGRGPIFRRLAEELQRADWEKVPPWRALHSLAEELQLPELSDLAEIMTSSGEEGVAVADTLQARARDLRNAQLAKEQAKAEAATEQMTGPQAALALVFGLMLITPPMLRIFFGE